MRLHWYSNASLPSPFGGGNRAKRGGGASFGRELVLWLVHVSNRCQGPPQIVVGQRCHDMDGLFGDGMDKRHLVRQQRDAAVGIASLGSILQVAFDGTADMGKLTAYLMVAAGHQMDLQQMVVVSMANDPVTQQGFLAVGHLTVVGVAFVLSFVAHDPVGECGGSFGMFLVMAQ